MHCAAGCATKARVRVVLSLMVPVSVEDLSRALVTSIRRGFFFDQSNRAAGGLWPTALRAVMSMLVELLAPGLVLPLAAWRAGSFGAGRALNQQHSTPERFPRKIFLLFYLHPRNKIAAHRRVRRYAATQIGKKIQGVLWDYPSNSVEVASLGQCYLRYRPAMVVTRALLRQPRGPG